MWLDRKSGTERSTACHWDILAGICGCLCKGLSDTILCNLVCMSTLRSTCRGSSCRWADCILEGTAIRTGCSPCSGDASPCSGDTRHSLCSRPTSCVGTLARTHSLGACAARSSTLLRGDRSGPCGGHCWVPRDDRSVPSSSDLERHLWCSRISQLAVTLRSMEQSAVFVVALGFFSRCLLFVTNETRRVCRVFASSCPPEFLPTMTIRIQRDHRRHCQGCPQL